MHERWCANPSLPKEEQDEYAIQSLAYAKKALADNVFDWELAPVEFEVRKKPVKVAEDESPKRQQ